eukprot:3643767-Rhodomonas_salina.1
MLMSSASVESGLQAQVLSQVNAKSDSFPQQTLSSLVIMLPRLCCPQLQGVDIHCVLVLS